MGAAIPKTRVGEPVFRIKQNSTRVPIEYTTVDEDQQLVPLLGATGVKFAYRLKGGTAVVTRDATIVDAQNGQVRYQWVPVDTITPGDYYAVWRVTFGDGTTQTFPVKGYQQFSIDADLG